MKKIITLLAFVFTLCALTFAAYADTFSGTMVRSNNADPNLFFHDGYYYLTQTGTSRIAVFKSKTLSGLNSLTINSNISYTAYLNGTVYDPAVEELFGDGATVNGTWSPEIHYFSEEQFPGQSGWYMFLGLRKNTGDSSMVRMVVLKSTTDSPKGPYGHPTKGTKNHSQPLLDKNGNIWDEWGCGQTVLTIPEGKYKGTYTMWVAEEGRGSTYGGKYGDFYQKIMIAKMSSPWQLAGDAGIVTTPTQQWEYAGSSTTHPRVVEGATPVYGKNGEVFITYSGSGYWSDYGLGQLTWNGGDPLKTSSWVKLPVANGNPIFSATTAKNLRGAGHASFLTDTDGNGFFCYHAYAYTYDTEEGKYVKASSRDAYIEPYYIDYTAWNGVSYGVIRLGINGNGVPADTSSTVTFATDGSYLTSPDIAAEGGTSITLTMSEANATGYIIYRSTDGEVFDYLTTVDATTYTDSDVTEGNTYHYRVYAYREEEISDASETVSAVAAVPAPTIELAVSSGSSLVLVTVTSNDSYDSIKLYRSTNNISFSEVGEKKLFTEVGDETNFFDDDLADGTYYYFAIGVKKGVESAPSNIEKAYIRNVVAPTITSAFADCKSVVIAYSGTEDYDSYVIMRGTENSTVSAKIAETTDTTFIDTNVVIGEKYYYSVMGVVDDITSSAVGRKWVTVSHAELAVEEKKATCTEDGYTAYTYCNYCDTVLSGKEIIPASGHTYALTEPEVPATTTSAGKTAVYTCANCLDSYGGEEIPMIVLGNGDVNNDGEITLVDVLRALKAVTSEYISAADTDGDGEITVSDVLEILKTMLNG